MKNRGRVKGLLTSNRELVEWRQGTIQRLRCLRVELLVVPWITTFLKIIFFLDKKKVWKVFLQIIKQCNKKLQNASIIATPHFVYFLPLYFLSEFWQETEDLLTLGKTKMKTWDGLLSKELIAKAEPNVRDPEVEELSPKEMRRRFYEARRRESHVEQDALWEH